MRKSLGRAWIVIVLAVSALVSAGLMNAPTVAAATQAEPGHVRTETDVVFGKAGNEELKLDLAMPSGGMGPYPALLCLQGNFWQYDKELTKTLTAAANKGYVAITVKYRQPPKHPFPAAIEDCKCAVRWLRANADTYQVNPERIGVLGLDSGGHLALLMALTTAEDGLEGSSDLTPGAKKQSSRVETAVSFFGATDLTSNNWSPGAKDRLAAFLGGKFVQQEQAYRMASPVTYVRQRTDWPPILVFHGTKDDEVPYAQSVHFVDAVKKAGGVAFLISLDGEGHGWRGAQLQKSIDVTFEFVGQRLKR